MKTKYIPLIPFLAFILLLLSPISATQAATNLPWTASSVAVDTNGVVQNPANFWNANSNSISALVVYGLAIFGTADQITVAKSGPTNTLSFPTNLVIPGAVGVGKTNSGSGLAVFGPLIVDGSEPGVSYGATNLALNKTATQSATYGAQDASYAVDGNTNTYANTTSAADAWWMVDLGASVYIAQVVITKMTGNGQYPLDYAVQACPDSNFISGVTTLVMVTNNSDIVTTFGAETFAPLATRYVRLTCIISPYAIVLGEISIYGPGESTSTTESIFNGPISLGKINGPVKIMGIATAWRTNTVVSNVQYDETGHVTNIVTTNLVYLSQ